MQTSEIGNIVYLPSIGALNQWYPGWVFNLVTRDSMNQIAMILKHRGYGDQLPEASGAIGKT